MAGIVAVESLGPKTPQRFLRRFLVQCYLVLNEGVHYRMSAHVLLLIADAPVIRDDQCHPLLFIERQPLIWIGCLPCIVLHRSIPLPLLSTSEKHRRDIPLVVSIRQD